jgi:hypothetical protein
MKVLIQGELYFEREHFQALLKEETYVRDRYRAVVLADTPESPLSKRNLANNIGLEPRQFNRIIERYKKYGIAGLRRQSRRPHNSPNRSPDWLEEMIVKVREKTGFGEIHIAALINTSMELQKVPVRVNKSTVYRALVRRGIIDAEKKAKIQWRHFEWGHPNRLIQADLTTFNGVPILTTEDDHSRKGWATRLADSKDTTVINGLRSLLRIRYDNLLTDNGGQFCRHNPRIIELHKSKVHGQPY